MSKNERRKRAREIAFYVLFSCEAQKRDPVEALEDIFDGLMEPEHPYRKLLELLNPPELEKMLNLESRPVFRDSDYPTDAALRTVILAFWKNLWGHSLQGALKDNLEIRWFSGYNIARPIPGRGYFNELVCQLGAGGIFRLMEKTKKNVAGSEFEGNWPSFEGPEDITEVLDKWNSEDSPKKTSPGGGLADEILLRVEGWIKNREKIDNTIREHLTKGRMEDLARVALSALRIGLLEMEYIPGVPRRVAVNEAIELAKVFGDKDLGRFVNGVLGARLKAISKKGDADEQKTGA